MTVTTHSGQVTWPESGRYFLDNSVLMFFVTVYRRYYAMLVL
jgi:hypothetical protein